MDRLPFDVLLTIFRHLSPTQIARIRRVSMRWQTLIKYHRLPQTPIEIALKQQYDVDIKWRPYDDMATEGGRYGPCTIEEMKRVVMPFRAHELGQPTIDRNWCCVCGGSRDLGCDDAIGPEWDKFRIRRAYISDIDRWPSIFSNMKTKEERVDAFIESVRRCRLLVVSIVIESTKTSSAEHFRYLLDFVSIAIVRLPNAFNVVRLEMNGNRDEPVFLVYEKR